MDLISWASQISVIILESEQQSVSQISKLCSSGQHQLRLLTVGSNLMELKIFQIMCRDISKGLPQSLAAAHQKFKTGIIFGIWLSHFMKKSRDKALFEFTLAHCGQKVHLRNLSFMYFQWKFYFFLEILLDNSLTFKMTYWICM